MVTWIPSIYPSHVSIYTSTMDPSWERDPFFAKHRGATSSRGVNSKRRVVDHWTQYQLCGGPGWPGKWVIDLYLMINILHMYIIYVYHMYILYIYIYIYMNITNILYMECYYHKLCISSYSILFQNPGSTGHAHQAEILPSRFLAVWCPWIATVWGKIPGLMGIIWVNSGLMVIFIWFHMISYVVIVVNGDNGLPS